MAGPPQTVVVFGGTGFLGRRVVGHLLARGFAVRAAARHPEKVRPPENAPLLTPVAADVGDDRAVAQAVAGAWGVVNAVSLYQEQGGRTFRSVHVEAAARVAAQARRAGVQRLVQVSGLGADPHSPSAYIRSRGEGEAAVCAAFPGAVVIRPSAMFAADEGFVTAIAGMLRRFPVFPMFGIGTTRLQPASVEDVGEAVARIMAAPDPAPLYEFGGPEVLTYKALLQAIARRLGLRRLLVPIPFFLWHWLAAGAERLPNPPLTKGQVELMQHDNTASHYVPGFADLAIAPRGIEAALDGMGDL